MLLKRQLASGDWAQENIAGVPVPQLMRSAAAASETGASSTVPARFNRSIGITLLACSYFFIILGCQDSSSCNASRSGTLHSGMCSLFGRWRASKHNMVLGTGASCPTEIRIGRAQSALCPLITHHMTFRAFTLQVLVPAAAVSRRLPGL